MINNKFKIVGLHPSFNKPNDIFCMIGPRPTKIKCPTIFKIYVFMTNLGPSFYYIMKQL